MDVTQLRRPQMRSRGDDLSPGRDPGREKEHGLEGVEGAGLENGRSKKHEPVLAAALVLLKHMGATEEEKKAFVARVEEATEGDDEGEGAEEDDQRSRAVCHLIREHLRTRDPVLTRDLAPHWLHASRLGLVEERLARYADLVQRLPPANRAALAALVRLLVAAAPAERRLAAFASVLCPSPSSADVDVDVNLHLKSCVALCADLVAHSARLFSASDARDEAVPAPAAAVEEWSWRVVEEPSTTGSSEGSNSSGQQTRMALSVVVSHGLGGIARARLYATRSPEGKVVLRLQSVEGDVDLGPGLHPVGEEEPVGESTDLDDGCDNDDNDDGVSGSRESRAGASARGGAIRRDATQPSSSSSSTSRSRASSASSLLPSPLPAAPSSTDDFTSSSSSSTPTPSTSSSPSSIAAVRSGSFAAVTAVSPLQRESLLLLLPTEIQQHIYSFLPIGQIFATLPLVCRDVHQTTQRDDVFWHGLYDLHFGGPPPAPSIAGGASAVAGLMDSGGGGGGSGGSGSGRGRRRGSGGELTTTHQRHHHQIVIKPTTTTSSSGGGGGPAGGRAAGGAKEPAAAAAGREKGDEEETDEAGEEEAEPTAHVWRKECERLMKELRDMEEDYVREVAVLEVELEKKKRKRARLHRRRRIKYAVEKCHLPLLKRFIRAADVSVDVPLTEKKATPLMFAAIRGNVPIVNWLLANGANVNAVEEGCAWQPIIHAAQGGHTEVVRILLSHGANVNARTEKGGTPLMHATYEGYADVVKIILEHGAEVNTQSKNGESALMMAAEKGHASIVRMLLETGADATLATHQSKRTAMWFAKENKQEDIVALFDEFAKPPTT